MSYPVIEQRAYLTAHKAGHEDMCYITASFEEVFAFKKICNENNIMYSVRFKRVDKSDDAYYCNGIKKPLFKKIKDTLTKRR
jgi:hypothetical protein